MLKFAIMREQSQAQLELCRADERDKSRGCLHTMPCKEEEDKVNVSKLNEVNQVQHDI